MTTASKSPGTGSPVSTISNEPASSRTGLVSLAPIVSAECTAMPSIAAASNGGDDRVAQMGSAVTRPTAWSSGSRTSSSRSGQPAAAHASSHAASASAAGRSWMNGAARATLTLSRLRLHAGVARPAPAGLQHLAPLVRIDVGRFRRVDEIEQHVEEALGVVQVREVAGSLEELETAGGHQLVCRQAMFHGDDGVALPPDEEKRQVLGEVQAVGGVHPLPHRVHDRAQSVDERRPG